MLSYLDSLPWSIKIPLIVGVVTVYVAFVWLIAQICAFNGR